MLRKSAAVVIDKYNTVTGKYSIHMLQSARNNSCFVFYPNPTHWLTLNTH